jgi:hypothetical protein
MEAAMDEEGTPSLPPQATALAQSMGQPTSSPGASIAINPTLPRPKEPVSPRRSVISTWCGYELLVWVVMNDHVHVVLTPFAKHPLESIVRGWKSYTTNALNRLGRMARVWQPEYMDRIIRSDRELEETIAYVLSNPEARWPGVQHYPWVWARWDDD